MLEFVHFGIHVAQSVSSMMNKEIRFVDLDTARATSGLRLVLLSDVPSPWSEALPQFFQLKGIPFVAVRFGIRDDNVRQWTGVHNAPAALYNDEPPLSHWSDLLALAERLEPRFPLIPSKLSERLEMLGLCHELMGQGGLVWHARLLIIDASLRTEGRCGFPETVAKYLARKYGYGAQPPEVSRQRVTEILEHLAARLESRGLGGSSLLLGDQLTALDVYSAAALGGLSPLPDEQRPLHPRMRHIFESAAEAIVWKVPAVLYAHRNYIHKHLELASG